MEISFLEMFSNSFGDARRAKRGLFWPSAWSKPTAQLCANSAAIEPARWLLGGFLPAVR